MSASSARPRMRWRTSRMMPPDGSAAEPYGDGMTLFDDGLSSGRSSAPLAVRMRPRSLDEVVGQDQALAPGSPLRTLLTAAHDAPVVSVILWGPPGTGKTTLASLLSVGSGRSFVELSAVTAGVKDVRQVIEQARNGLGMHGRGTVLFIDEVHRFSKTQQDALLPAVENGWVTLIAATTENPNFSVISPLLSRSVVVALSPLTDDHVQEVVERAIADPRGLGGAIEVDDEALAHLVRTSNGDARRALTGLDAAATSAIATGQTRVTLADAERAVQQASVPYDKDGDQHYDVISAFIKSLRGSDPDAALHYLARMIEAGEDPRFIARRLMILASEDIGMADPSALQTAIAAAQAVATDRHARGRHHPRARDDPLRAGAEVERRDRGSRRLPWPMCTPAASAGCLRHFATATIPARPRSATVAATCTRTTSPAAWPRSSTCPTSSQIAPTTGRPITEPRRVGRHCRAPARDAQVRDR